jgi:diaminopimelate decarboxylase/solute carrier family 35 protein E1
VLTTLCCHCRAASKLVGVRNAPTAVTLSFIAIWYGLNIAFNLQVC